MHQRRCRVGAPDVQEVDDNNSGDDEERDLADDPLLSELDADLSRVTKRTDRTMLMIMAIGLPLTLISQAYATGLTRTIGTIAGALIVVGSIPYTILRTIRLKRQIATQYGLSCNSCGYNPGGMYALATATVPRCRKCRATLAPHRNS
jgi:hypothetical protein